MLQNTFLTLAIVITLSLNTVFSEEVECSINISPITEDQAVQNAKLVNSGTVTKTESKTHNGIKVWEVYMITSSGGELKIKYRVDDGTMVEIKGISASFDYEIEPGMNLVNYSVAKSVAVKAKNGEILEWKLEKDESDNRWEYRFKIRSVGQEWKIRINTATGVVKRIN